MADPRLDVAIMRPIQISDGDQRVSLYLASGDGFEEDSVTGSFGDHDDQERQDEAARRHAKRRRTGKFPELPPVGEDGEPLETAKTNGYESDGEVSCFPNIANWKRATAHSCLYSHPPSKGRDLFPVHTRLRLRARPQTGRKHASPRNRRRAPRPFRRRRSKRSFRVRGRGRRCIELSPTSIGRRERVPRGKSGGT